MTTSFFIALRQGCYDDWSSPCLEWFGCCTLNQNNASKLAQLFCWKKKKEGMECCSSLFVLDYLGREKKKEH